MFIDEVKIYARAGHGGRGAVAFHREAYRPKGGPSGGNGGRGGDVILEANHDLNNLIQQFFQPRLLAEDGHQGMGRGKDGKAGKDLVIKVPCGTVVWRIKKRVEEVVSETGETGEESGEPAAPGHTPASTSTSTSTSESKSESDPDSTEKPASPDPSTPPRLQSTVRGRDVVHAQTRTRAIEWDPESEDEAQAPTTARVDEERELVCDLTSHGQRFVLCKGGRGGLGNRNFATAVRQAPRFAQPGEVGQEDDYRFELRLLADVGLVGYPNAGKSTLLTAISHARPRIAAYPFTTLTPQVGIVEYEDFFRLIVCDIPGIIEGAHENVGLGHAFLRHIQRCHVLVILVDMAGTDGRLPWDDYKHIISELEQYSPSLLERHRLVVANKMDEPVAVDNLKKFKRKVPKTPVLQMSAGLDDGIDAFRKAIREAVELARQPDKTDVGTSDPTPDSSESAAH